MQSVRKEEVQFTNGTTRLTGSLSLPASGSGHPALIALHAAGAGETSFILYQHLAQVLPEHGIAVLLYDRRGSGSSEGDFASASFDTLVEDARAGIELLQSRPEIDPQRIGAWGVSQGSWFVPMLASRNDLKALVLASSVGVSPERQMDYSAESMLRAAGFADGAVSSALRLRRSVNAYYRDERQYHEVQREVDMATAKPWFEHALVSRVLPESVVNSKWALELTYDPTPFMAGVAAPTLLIYSEQDPWVPVEESIEAWQAVAPEWVEVVRLPEANHLMMTATPDTHEGQSVSRQYEATLTSWLARYL